MHMHQSGAPQARLNATSCLIYADSVGGHSERVTSESFHITLQLYASNIVIAYNDTCRDAMQMYIPDIQQSSQSAAHFT